MTWTANPFFTIRERLSMDPEASPRRYILKTVQHGFLEPSERFTGHQAFYLLVPHGIIAAVISGGINLAIAEGMYGTTKQSINLFQFPNTLVGDATVTIILQCIITWMIELILVNQDLRKGRIQSIGTVSEPKNAAVRWFMFMDRGEETCKRGSFKHWVLFLYSQILRGFMISVVCFALLIGPVIGFLILVGKKEGGDWTYISTIEPSLATWKPQIFKAILGAVSGILTTPLYALFWLTRCGWALKNHEKHYGEQ